jgi:hypothetical protein
MGRFLTADEVISGREGEILVNIEGNIITAAEIKKIEAKAVKVKNPFKVIGKRTEQNKTTGAVCTGTMTMYYGNTLWAKLTEDYIKTGKDIFFSILLTNEDPSIALGAQRIRLNGVNLNEVVIASLDADTDFLTQDVAFTFDDFDILNEFTPITI